VLFRSCPPTGAVLAHAESHIERDERGAPEFFTGGGKLHLLGGDHAKISLDALDAALAANQPNFVHETPLAALSITNLTESGAAYSVDETAVRAERAKAHGLAVHLDGARFANAVIGTGASPADLSWRAGADILTFGATKNGALGCEAIVLFGDTRRRHAELLARAKRAGHMPPKARFLAAQMDAYLTDDLWRELAGTANARATQLAQGLAALPGASLAHPVDGNEVFARLPDPIADALREAGAQFYRWLDGSYRFVCYWSTPEEEVASLLKVARRAADNAAQ